LQKIDASLSLFSRYFALAKLPSGNVFRKHR
jgi:hypothetical protein